MPAVSKWIPTSLLTALALTALARPAHAYVDLTPTLSKVMQDSRQILLVEATLLSKENSSLVFSEIKTLKGPATTGEARHGLSWDKSAKAPQQLLQWARPGARGVLFVSGNVGILCIGQGWYQINAAAPQVWKLGPTRPDLPLAYYGAISRLADGIERMQAGKDAILTVVAYGGYDEGASFDLALNRANLPGLVKVQRICARLKMPDRVMASSANPAYLVGPGRAGESELPDLLKSLKSPAASIRAEAAEDLGWLGKKSELAIVPLAEALEDDAPAVRVAAAAALLRINPKAPGVVDVLSKELDNPDPATRREAARAAGLAGPAAAPLTRKLARLLKDPDPATKFAALQALSTLGPTAAPVAAAVSDLLDEDDLAIDTADALGRIGPAAAPALPRLAQMLDSEDPAVRWAAVRGMSQIGTEGAQPAVDFMIKALPKATEVDGYNMMIYLAMLGPAAKDAVPAIQRAWIKNPVLPTATLWAIEPTKQFPWQSSRRFGSFVGGEGPEFARLIYESYVRELGERLAPAAKVLSQKILDGNAGDIPAWGYKILAADVPGTLAILTPKLADEDLITRERAAVALGYMGPAAADAHPQVERALYLATDEREKRLLAWCLREIRPN